MKLNKKLLLSFGAIASVATPIVATVSCGSKHSTGSGGYSGITSSDYHEVSIEDVTKYDKELPDLPLIAKDPTKSNAMAHTASTYDIAVNQFYSTADTIIRNYMYQYVINHKWQTSDTKEANTFASADYAGTINQHWDFRSWWGGHGFNQLAQVKTSFEGFVKDSKGNVYIQSRGWYVIENRHETGIFTFPNGHKYYLGTWDPLLGDFMHPFVHSSAEEVKQQAVNEYISSPYSESSVAESMSKASAWVDDHGVWNIPLDEINYVTSSTSSSHIYYNRFNNIPQYPQQPLTQEDVNYLKDPRTNFHFE